jgi:PAS domain S-box-containing protein
MSDGRWKRTTGETLHRMVHSVTGTAGTFGLQGISMAARQFEQHLAKLLNVPMPPTEHQWSELEADLAQLKVMGFDIHPIEPQPAEAEPVLWPSKAPLVHLVCDCDQQSEQLPAALALKGYRVELFSNPVKFQMAAASPDSEQPSAVVLNMSCRGTDLALPAMIQQLGLADHPSIPLIVGLAQVDLRTRVDATRAGARHSLQQPLSPELLVDALDNLVGGAQERPWRVLLVDDEPNILKVHEVYLRQAGMDVRTLTDPMQTLVEVVSFEPDVLVIDVYMPEVNGPEIAAALRESNIRPHLAIVFLSAETDMTQQLVALDLGGDDFLIKPVQPRHLVAAVTARARRARKNTIVQKRLETTLYERQREQLAYDQHAIVSIIDRHGNITYVNDLFCQLSGYRREELIQHHHSLVKSDKNPSGLLRKVREETSSNRVWQGEIGHCRKDGSSYWTETTITPFLDEKGSIYQYVAIQTDITHIKETETALRRQHGSRPLDGRAHQRHQNGHRNGTSKQRRIAGCRASQLIWFFQKRRANDQLVYVGLHRFEYERSAASNINDRTHPLDA